MDTKASQYTYEEDRASIEKKLCVIEEKMSSWYIGESGAKLTRAVISTVARWAWMSSRRTTGDHHMSWYIWIGEGQGRIARPVSNVISRRVTWGRG